MARVKTVGKISEFMSGEFRTREKAERRKKVRSLTRIASSAVLPIVSGGTVGTLGLIASTTAAFACEPASAIPVSVTSAVGESATRTIAHALDPLVDILVAISLPVTSVIMVGGCFFFMFGNTEKAWNTIQNAGLGYVLVQLSPLFVKILEQVGKSI